VGSEMCIRDSYSVSVVQVTVYGAATFSSEDFQGPSEDWPLESAHSCLRELFTVAEVFIKQIVDHTRTHLGQHWIAASTDVPRTVWLSDFLDTASGDRIPVSLGGHLTVRAMPMESRLTSENLEQIADLSAAETEVPLFEDLLSDAKYLAWVRDPPDLRLACLLAAIACEVKTKWTLSSLVDPAAEKLLTIIMKNPRDVTVSVPTHLNKTAGAVSGRSLSEEDQHLFKAAERLFRDRNKIAHGKEAQPSDEEMNAAVRAAVGVSEWLDSLLISEDGT